MADLGINFQKLCKYNNKGATFIEESSGRHEQLKVGHWQADSCGHCEKFSSSEKQCEQGLIMLCNEKRQHDCCFFEKR
jgi:hypothetical protein